MGNYHIGDGECRFRVVCSSPDVCEVVILPTNSGHRTK